MKRNDKLQSLCRMYLRKLRYMAQKHGLGWWIDSTIKANARNECSGTEHEVQMLARLCDDERVKREEIPSLLNAKKNNIDFDKIKCLRRLGIYSKVDALLYVENIKDKNNKRK